MANRNILATAWTRLTRPSVAQSEGQTEQGEPVTNVTEGSAAKAAFDVWNQYGVSLENVERFIHDNQPMDKLVERGEGLVGAVRAFFPWALPKSGGVVMEVGSGVGYPLQAALRSLDPARIIGLDVAEGMIALAKERLARDGIVDRRIEFLHYDGIHIPLPDNSVDFVYSVAALQHIPRIFIYNLLYELKRVLKPSGYCSAQILAFSQFSLVAKEERAAAFHGEVKRQLVNTPNAWVTYYSFEELLYVLSDGVDVKDVHVLELGGSLWFSFCKSGPNSFHYPWLPRLRHEVTRALYEGL